MNENEIEYRNKPSVKVTSYNNRTRQLKNKMKIRKRRVFAGALVATNLLIAISFYNIGKNHQDIGPEPTIPSGYILTETIEIVDYGDTVYDIAKEYYNPAYAGIYPTLNDYTRAIQEQNNLDSSAKIIDGQPLRLPVIVSPQNDYFIKALEIQKKIDEIKRNNYWVEYTVKPGDTVSALAARASGDFGETPLLTLEIIDKNHLSGNFRDGIVILTINPELGPLKIELKEAQSHFQQSIKVNPDQDQDQNQDDNDPKAY